MSVLEKTKYKSVYKRNGKKDTTYYIKYKKFGKSTEKKVGTESTGMTAAKAKKVLEETLANLRKGLDEETVISISNNVTVTSKMSLDRLSELYFEKFDRLAKEEEHLEAQDKTSKNIEGIRREKSLYKSIWGNWTLTVVPFYKLNPNHFVKHIRDLQKMTKTQVRDLEEVTLPKYSSKYLLNALTLIKSIITHTNCSHNPLDLANNKNTKEYEELQKIYEFLKKKSTPREHYLEPNEIKKLLEKLKEKEQYHQGYLMTKIIATTGMRPDSCLNLRISDLMFKDKLIKTIDFKRKKMVYYCNLTPSLSLELQEFVKGRNPSDFVFFSDKTKAVEKLPRVPDYISDVINEIFNQRRYGKDRIVLYTLRHSFATNLVKGRLDEKGDWLIMPVSIFKIQKLLNHSTIETTIKHYAKFSPDFAKEAIDSYEESFI